MLSEKERQGISDILINLHLEDLVSLTDTVTNRMVSAENRQEAVQAILLYSVSAAQLLKRKKVRREHLYKYLAEQGCIEPTTSDKPFLCRKILKLWGSPEKESETDDADENVSKFVPNRQNTVESEQKAMIQPTDKEVTTSEGQNLAEHFVPWFYGLLNSIANSDVASTQDCWGHQHFWDDSKCTVTVMSVEHREEECIGALAASDKLKEVVAREKLFLNVNQSSIKGDLDTYGLGKIIAGGTVHRFQQCLGIFEQSFGLIRDPQTDNNWKIKFTHLKLKAQELIQGSQIAANDQKALAGQ